MSDVSLKKSGAAFAGAIKTLQKRVSTPEFRTNITSDEEGYALAARILHQEEGFALQPNALENNTVLIQLQRKSGIKSTVAIYRPENGGTVFAPGIADPGPLSEKDFAAGKLMAMALSEDADPEVDYVAAWEAIYAE